MSKKADAERTVIGKIAATHGVRGTMIIFPLTDYPERFLEMKELVLDKQGKPRRTLKVASIAPYEGKGTFFLRAEGIDDKETAEKLKGSFVTVENADRVPLSDDEYWIDDIVGMTVTEDGAELGKVEEVMATGSNDVYLVRTPDGALKPIPAIESAIQSVDMESGIISVKVPEGLWD